MSIDIYKLPPDTIVWVGFYDATKDASEVRPVLVREWVEKIPVPKPWHPKFMAEPPGQVERIIVRHDLVEQVATGKNA